MGFFVCLQSDLDMTSQSSEEVDVLYHTPTTWFSIHQMWNYSLPDNCAHIPCLLVVLHCASTVEDVFEWEYSSMQTQYLSAILFEKRASLGVWLCSCKHVVWHRSFPHPRYDGFCIGVIIEGSSECATCCHGFPILFLIAAAWVLMLSKTTCMCLSIMSVYTSFLHATCVEGCAHDGNSVIPFTVRTHE